MEVSRVRPKILVVDDAQENLMVLQSILSDDYSLKLVSNSKEALDYASANPPDLILLDIMMPEIDGFEACRRLKANPKLADVPVIFITSKSDVEDEEQGFAVGASDFITKPISAPIVSARVKTHIKIKFMMDVLKIENATLQKSAEKVSSELQDLKSFIWGSQYTRY